MDVGDVIVSVDGKPISTAAELEGVLATLKPSRSWIDDRTDAVAA